MDFNKYQDDAHKTAIYEDNRVLLDPAQVYALMGLVGEAGEVANLCKKALRGDFGQDPYMNQEFIEKLIGELGGQLWYMAEICTVFNLSLENIAAQNLAKLADRSARGVLQGSGDDR